MNSFTLTLGSAKPGSILAAIIGIAIASSQSEADFVPMGNNIRSNEDLLVRLGSGDNAPMIEGDRVVECSILRGTEVQSGGNAIWLERVQPNDTHSNESLVKVENIGGYTLIQGNCKTYASGPGTSLMRFKPNTAVAFSTPKGEQFVVYTNNDARKIQVVETPKFDISMLSTETATKVETTGAGSSR